MIATIAQTLGRVFGLVGLAVLTGCQPDPLGSSSLSEASLNGGGCKRASLNLGQWSDLLGIACLPGAEADWAKSPIQKTEDSLPILLMPGHGDYQLRAGGESESASTSGGGNCGGSAGHGTNGEARDNAKATRPAKNLDPSPCPGEDMWELTDEVCWNIALIRKIEEMAPSDLRIVTYDTGRKGVRPLYTDLSSIPRFDTAAKVEQPALLPTRCIPNPENPYSGWAQGYAHYRRGGYALEIHFDAWNKDGQGSGVIVANPLMSGAHVRREDIALAQYFGAYPSKWRNVLGGPNRGISFLEIGQLKGTLESSLRNPATRERTLETLASRILRALQEAKKNSATVTSPLESR